MSPDITVTDLEKQREARADIIKWAIFTALQLTLTVLPFPGSSDTPQSWALGLCVTGLWAFFLALGVRDYHRATKDISFDEFVRTYGGTK